MKVFFLIEHSVAQSCKKNYVYNRRDIQFDGTYIRWWVHYKLICENLLNLSQLQNTLKPHFIVARNIPEDLSTVSRVVAHL